MEKNDIAYGIAEFEVYSDDIVIFPDVNLDKVIRNKINKNIRKGRILPCI